MENGVNGVPETRVRKSKKAVGEPSVESELVGVGLSRKANEPTPLPEHTDGHTSTSSAALAWETELKQMIANLEQSVASQSAKVEKLRPHWETEFGSFLPMDKISEVLKTDALKWQIEKYSDCQQETLCLRRNNIMMSCQLQAAEKTDKKLRKVAKQCKENETKCADQNEELKNIQHTLNRSTATNQISSAASERQNAQNKQLQARIQELQQQLASAKEGLELTEMYRAKNKEQAEELARLDQAKADLQKSINAQTKEVSHYTQRHRENEQKVQVHADAFKGLVALLKERQKEVSALRDTQKQLKSDCDLQLRSLVDSFRPLSMTVENIGKMMVKKVERYGELRVEKKRLNNLVLMLKGNIRTFVRVRPINKVESDREPKGEATVGFWEDTKLGIYDETQARRKWFEFDQCFDMQATQMKVFEEVKPLACSVLDGYNVCIFAYGQTGSGKTFTMAGNAANPGLNTNVLRELFRIRDERRVEADIKIVLMIAEIYNETVKDLLGTKPKKLEVKQNPDGSTLVVGLTEIGVDSVEAVLACMERAQSNRSVMKTDMNDESSRSHSIVQVKTTVQLHNSKKVYTGKINLIDLAGSENVGKSGVTEQGLREAQNINKSLSALGDVIQALVSKTSHVPYRNSKLTLMLKDSLGGESKTLMIVQCSPAQINVTETLSSLTFAARARNVELGKAKQKVKGSD